MHTALCDAAIKPLSELSSIPLAVAEKVTGANSLVGIGGNGGLRWLVRFGLVWLLEREREGEIEWGAHRLFRF